MNDYLELPWSMRDTIENMKMLKEIVSEMAKRKNYDGRGETDAKEIEFDFDRAISALEKQTPRKPVFHEETEEDYKSDTCPRCGEYLSISVRLYEYKYCFDCGQKLDWSVEDD